MKDEIEIINNLKKDDDIEVSIKKYENIFSSKNKNVLTPNFIVSLLKSLPDFLKNARIEIEISQETEETFRYIKFLMYEDIKLLGVLTCTCNYKEHELIPLNQKLYLVEYK
jgi:hypothetical protein